MNGHDSAFPWSIGNLDNCAPGVCEGVTKRELFAALICSGIIANPDCSTDMARVAEGAVDMADTLIDALNKPVEDEDEDEEEGESE
jgi:hypothetical protein